MKLRLKYDDESIKCMKELGINLTKYVQSLYTENLIAEKIKKKKTKKVKAIVETSFFPIDHHLFNVVLKCIWKFKRP